jgi:lipopolysaccharide transport system ATP-binding protein
VGSLLEVGAGFHPELTGLENVYLSGATLGMRHSEIQRQLEEILAFAEVEQFADTPVKHYSSGMYMRLAFAVAAHLNTDILLIDEVLAVGDARFQRKCVNRIGRMCRDGRTALFVSHNMGLVRQLCNSALLLAAGAVSHSGPADSVIQAFLEQCSIERDSDLGKVADRKGAGEIRFRSLRFQDVKGDEVGWLTTGEPARIVLGVRSARRHGRVQACFALLDEMNQRVLYLNSYFVGPDLPSLPINGALVCDIPRVHLAPGRYRLEIWVKSEEVMQDRISDIGPVQVRSGEFFPAGECPPPGSSLALMDYSWQLYGRGGQPASGRQVQFTDCVC